MNSLGCRFGWHLKRHSSCRSRCRPARTPMQRRAEKRASHEVCAVLSRTAPSPRWHRGRASGTVLLAGRPARGEGVGQSMGERPQVTRVTLPFERLSRCRALGRRRRRAGARHHGLARWPTRGLLVQAGRAVGSQRGRAGDREAPVSAGQGSARQRRLRRQHRGLGDDPRLRTGHQGDQRSTPQTRQTRRKPVLRRPASASAATGAADAPSDQSDDSER